MYRTCLILAYWVLSSAHMLAQNPVPLTSQPLLPSAVAPGGPQFTLTVNGTGFVSGASVNWNGTPLATTFVSSSQLTATVPAQNIISATTAVVTVTNPATGPVSNSQYLSVTKPVDKLGFASPIGPTGQLAVDLNADGKLDLLSIDGSTVAVALGNGDGTFQPIIESPPVPFTLSEIAVADINGDGKLDLLGVGCLAQGDTCASGSLEVFIGNGDGTFQQPVAYNTGALATTAVVAADFNGDGKVDLVVTNDCEVHSQVDCSNATLGVLLGSGDGTFQALVNYSSGGWGGGVTAVADLDGDGNLDLVSASYCSVWDPHGYAWEPCLSERGMVGVLLGNGDGTFQSVQTNDFVGVSSQPFVLADVTGDGRLDLLIMNGCISPGFCNSGVDLDPAPSVLLGNGDGTFQAPVNYPLSNPPAGLAVADMNGDGKLDMVISAGVMLGNGDGTFKSPVSAAGTPLIAADLNGDGLPDLVSKTGISLNIAPTTSTRLTSYPNPSLLGDSVTFTATVTSSAQGPPTGTVSFFDGTTNLGNSPLNGSGVAVLLTSTLSQGTHSVTASYSGDFDPSTSAGLNQVVRFVTSTLLTASPSPSFATQTVTLTATVSTQADGSPTGTVSFLDGSASLGSSPVNGNGVATLAVTKLGSNVPAHSITANYNGDSSFGTSSSPAVNQVVQDFGLGLNNPTSQTVTPGQAANYSGDVYPINGFSQSVSLTCSGGPKGSICSVTPSVVMLDGSNLADFSVAVVTQAARMSLQQRVPRRRAWSVFAIWVGTFGMFLVVGRNSLKRPKRMRLHRSIFLLLLLGITMMPACGGGDPQNGSGSAGTYTVTIRGTFADSVQLTRTTVVTVVVK